jgi:3-keto-5-aminohexanoate cleavage enzyme
MTNRDHRSQNKQLHPLPVVICVAPNGARRTKQDHGRLPLTCEELTAEAKACMAAGATAIHVHVRDEAGQHTLDGTIYRKAIDSIQSATGGDMLVQMTTEACGIFTPQQQMAAVREVRPEAASVAVRELVRDDDEVSEAASFFTWAQDRCIGLQYVVYDQKDLLRTVRLHREGIIPHEQPHLLLVLGRYSANLTSNPDDLLPFASLVPRDWPWSVCAFGISEAQCMRKAVDLGGNCRVGFENNLLLPNGERASENAALVANVRIAIQESNRTVGSIRDARALYVG